jgi:hypothetical protein
MQKRSTGILVREKITDASLKTQRDAYAELQVLRFES